jgi:hypothetical protein
MSGSSDRCPCETLALYTNKNAPDRQQATDLANSSEDPMPVLERVRCTGTASLSMGPHATAT